MTDDAPVVNNPCDACGQADDHPMIHVAYAIWKKDDRTSVVEPSFHFDCLPAEYRVGLDAPEHAVTVAAIEKAESGVHGDDLRKFILKQPSDNDIEPQEVSE